MFQFQTGSIKRLYENRSNIMLDPCGTCQGDFLGLLFFGVCCCQPPVMQILWEVDGIRQHAGLSTIYPKIANLFPIKTGI